MLSERVEGLVEAARRIARDQVEAAEKVAGTPSGRPEDLDALVKRYEARKTELRSALKKGKSALSVAASVSGGEAAAAALEAEIKSCDATIASLVKETKAALASIDTISDAKDGNASAQ